MLSSSKLSSTQITAAFSHIVFPSVGSPSKIFIRLLPHLPHRPLCSASHPSAAQQLASHRRAIHERNRALGLYFVSIVVGVVGSTYAAVPLYKVFCQNTGFGGATRRAEFGDEVEDQISKKVLSAENFTVADTVFDGIEHTLSAIASAFTSITNTEVPQRRIGASHGVNTWTDEGAAASLSSLVPDYTHPPLRISFDATVGGDNLPWSFVPTQRFVTVVPGETALSFFTARNKASVPITGVSTYNVNPPIAGKYFVKVQCFCFEEQRLLAGEEVDMPVFFYIDPAIKYDKDLVGVSDITLSYTFFLTDTDDDDDINEDDDVKDDS
eukprot:CAMPEP_0113319114 /NCGR_PEP_ID=MMETSP0010_2-20120614/13440_1 /TAXON_ID=216773 ORGANISM="Corethron hystrix, Strain 308" /NCGR_SAMPLE_ID=MMETSP0010_2 /ASSEMBLY_ACC=CAM_ASM_000155 /LENGTH=324 /DNA_ID=CAMNT_0000176607 /DNA_START=148 /DNA_END=1122 /DNA_ORIENTATION=- /assembly_acc=CAM_ASM_000155